MSVKLFDWEELVVLSIIDGKSRDDAISKIKETLPYIDEENMVALVKNIEVKLSRITDAEYQEIDLVAYKNLFDEEDE